MSGRNKNASESPTRRAQAKAAAPPAPGARIARTASDAPEYLGAFYVVDHHRCDLPDLPGTKADATGWLRNRVDYQERNFLFGNDVEELDRADFNPAHDDRTAKLPAGKSGIDSVVAAYIATHGHMMADGHYAFGIGNANNKCNSISTEQMELGDDPGRLRYLFMSSCDAVNREDASLWFTPAKGIRAVFGYEGSIIDSPDLGKFFFQNWKKKDATTSQAFIDASWRVNHDQIAVAAWFGHTENAADNACENEDEFQHDRIIDPEFIVTKWHENHDLTSNQQLLEFPGIGLVFRGAPPGFDFRQAVRPFLPDELLGDLDKPYTRESSGNNESFRSDGGVIMIRNARSGSLDVQYPALTDADGTTKVSPDESSGDLTDEAAIAIATEHLQRVGESIPGLRSTGPGLCLALGVSASAVRRTCVASIDRQQNKTKRVKHVTVIFRQTFHGLATVGTGGVVEVTLKAHRRPLDERDGKAELCRVRSVTREIAAVLPTIGPCLNVPLLADKAKARALKEVYDTLPDDGKCTVIKSEFGYHTKDEDECQHESEPTYRVLVRYDVARRLGEKPSLITRLVEKFYTASDLL